MGNTICASVGRERRTGRRENGSSFLHLVPLAASRQVRARTVRGALWIALLVASAGAQEPVAAPRIKAIEFSGLSGVDEAVARRLVGLTEGDSAEPAALDAAVARLLRDERILTARCESISEDDGVRLRFHVLERSTVRAMRFEGATRFSEGQLRKQVPFHEGDELDRFAVREACDAIEAHYRESGYAEARVTVDWAQARDTGQVVFAIHEGSRLRIREVGFEGNAAFAARELKRHVRTRPALWILRSGAFEEEQVEADAVALQNFYRDEGFLDARVSYRREVREGGELRLVFQIEEGKRYAIESITFEGLSVFYPQELLDVMQCRTGDIVRRPAVAADAQTIRQRYWALGYVDVEVRPIRLFSDTPDLVRLTFQVQEGGQFRVGHVSVRGNARTRDKVARRALNLYPPDDLFDLNEANEAERRLMDTGVFSSARVLPVESSPGVRDAIIDVQEAEKAGDFLFGVGVTSNSGLVGTVVLDLQNFDLFDPPRNLRELFKFRSFFGGGQRLRIQLEPGADVNRFRIDFTEPYFLDKPLRFDASLYLFERGRDGYTERRGGPLVSFGRRLEQGPLAGWSSELAFGVEAVNVDDVDLFASREIRDDAGSQVLTSVKGTLVRDRTESRYLPTTGDRLRLGYEQFGLLGGDHVFGKLSARYQWYRTLRTDILERKSVLQFHAEGGLMVGDAPVFERFYAGGTGTLRGFAFRGVGEHDGIDDNNIGGDYLVLLGAEYAYPLFGDNLRGHIFVDTGTVGSGSYRASLGTGIRLTIPALGPVPLEFNLAVPVLRGADDDEQVFSFLVGGLF